MRRISFIDVVCCYARDGMASRETLHQLDLEGVDAGDVIHDYADRATVSWYAGLPLGLT
jgi:hypothetical protein